MKALGSHQALLSIFSVAVLNFENLGGSVSVSIIEIDIIFFPSFILSIVIVIIIYFRGLAQNTTATATRTSPNKRFYEQNNGCARAL